MPPLASSLTSPASTEHHNLNSPLLSTRQEAPKTSTTADDPDSPIPTLSDEAILGITLSIIGAAILFLLIWYLRRRSKRRAGDARHSEIEKWDPVQRTTTSPSRSWVDADVERQPEPPRFEMNRQVHAGQVWAAPKWNAVAERMAQHERGRREASRGGRLSKPPPAVTRRPTGDGTGQQDGQPKEEPYVAMLWAPGHRGTLQ